MKASTITKKMMLDCIARQCNAAIKERKRIAGCHKHPLFAWIKGAPTIGGKSRIQCVIDNQARWPWRTLNAAGHDFKKRLTAKKKLSFVQKNMLNDYIEIRYPGRYDWNYLRKPEVVPASIPMQKRALAAGDATSNFVQDCLGKNPARYGHEPLRLILSPEFCVLINLKFMEFYL